MLSQAEYLGYVNDINDLGAATDQQLQDYVNSGATQQQAVTRAKEFMNQYVNSLSGIMNEALYEIATNTLEHYQSQMKMDLPDDIVKAVVKDQYRKRYYGATLQQRLILSKLRLNRIATQTAATGLDNMGGIFTQAAPFGAQSNISKRLLQGAVIKVEQDVARKVAEATDYPLIKWTLAKGHKHQCECEELASNVNKDVVSYIRENDIDSDTKGVYFIDDLPDPPHPNCQCEFILVGKDQIVPSEGTRSLGRIHSLIRKILRS